MKESKEKDVKMRQNKRKWLIKNERKKDKSI